APALALAEPVHVVCRQDKSDRLLADLAVFALDLVLADAPVGPGSSVKAFNHLLGECGVTFFAVDALARSRRRGFPRSLDGAPMLLPTANSALRRALEQWFLSNGIRPRVVAECDDSALLKVIGQSGAGIVPAPTVAEAEIRRHYQLAPLGRTDEVRERFYAISLERRIKHPAVVAISQSARAHLFGDSAKPLA
ncbi:MAG: LysR substrate-binding domain-containing protein, partial [Polyangiales bacterium]